MGAEPKRGFRCLSARGWGDGTTVFAANFAARAPKRQRCACSSRLGVTEATLRRVEPFGIELATAPAEAG